MFGFGFNEPETILYVLVSFVVATTIHEFMHAWTAWYLGDDTAQRLGRITLNPVMHFDPFGFFGMVLIAIGVPAIGWGKPVPVNPNRLRGQLRGRRLGMAIVAFAGPLSNVVQAAAVALPFWLTGGSLANPQIEEFLRTFIVVNLLLAAFNMIPVPPLDGSRILFGFLPSFWQPFLFPLERYGIGVLFVLAIFGRQFGGESIILAAYGPVFDLLARVLTNDLRF
jgi:Zn-dependent protease